MLHKEWNILKEPPIPIEHFFIKIIEEKRGTKVVTQIYQCLYSFTLGSALDIKEK